MSPVLGAQSTKTPACRLERLTMRQAMATVLIAAAIVALATTSLFHPQEQATAQSLALAPPVPLPPASPLSVAVEPGEVRPFAFGYLVFENATAEGVPGFGPLPPGASAR